MPRFEPNPQRRPTVVAGASAGIGAATALALAADGHPVALGARRVEVCEELAAKIRADGGQAVALPLDVTSDDSVRSFVARTREELGEVEILVYGAGDLDADPVHEMDAARFAGQLDVHLGGAHRLVSAIVPGMVERRRGDVVLIGSDVVVTPRPRMGAYVPAKAGLEAMAHAMRMELEGTGVRASVVRPGPTSTSMGMKWDHDTTQAVLDDWVKWGLARHPYFLRASDIAEAVHHVVSAPRGVHLSLIEVQPEAPLEET
ncbi:SDR family oxidoreductase [Saccharopolyspora flava]|uniref:NADP-dependent 3-hydroxy acid dehydrogenase YdfG n=1 Tax=Saccharopolyspora flava TaxID=95161 RepID=A0A1I6RFF6_9PSEU|nr:SDR family oxidoreductase [Saccharopolyspora flava]SFS63433.1 NADP-dependent 3-hydroxy acid dehydrogenase YdfG [Saccharopolyspora flava]